MKLSAFLCLLPLIFAQVPPVAAQTEPPSTPVGALSRKAGVLLGAADYLQVFKSSKCGYALSKTIPTAEELLTQEVVPAFPDAFKLQVKSAFEGIKAERLRLAEHYVAEALREARRKRDEQTACGVAGGMLLGIFASAMEGWTAQKVAYRAGRM